MRIQVISILFLILVAFPLFAETADELQSRLSGNIPDLKRNEIYLKLGDIYSNDGRLQDALNYYLRVLDGANSPKQYLTASEKAAETYFVLGNTAKSIDILKDALRLNPQNISLRKKLGSYYSAADLYEHAVSEYEEIIKIARDRDALESLGDIHKKRGLYRRALDYYERAVFIGPSPEIFQKISFCYENTGEINLAELMLKKALEEMPNYEGYMQLGKLYYSKRAFDKSIEAFSGCVRFFPEKAEAYIYIGMSYYKNNQLTEAEKIFKILLDKNKEPALSYFFLGIILDKRGMRNEAKAAFSKAIENSRSNFLSKYAEFFSRLP